VQSQEKTPMYLAFETLKTLRHAPMSADKEMSDILISVHALEEQSAYYVSFRENYQSLADDVRSIIDTNLDILSRKHSDIGFVELKKATDRMNLHGVSSVQKNGFMKTIKNFFKVQIFS